MSADPSPPVSRMTSPSEVDVSRMTLSELHRALPEYKNLLSSCTLRNSWLFTVPSVALSVPLCVRYRTYTPLVFAAVTASGADYVRGLSQCDRYYRTVNAIKKRIAEIELIENVAK